MIHYRSVTVDTVEPSSPQMGEIWIKPIGSSTYQGYMWISTKWCPFISGGNFITETGADTHYVNIVVQESQPNDFIKPGWIWIKESIKQAYLYIFDYIVLTGE